MGTIQAAGRVLSQHNQERLTAIFSEVASIMLDAKVITAEKLQALLKEEIEEDALGDELEDASVKLEAGSLADDITESNWIISVDNSFNLFRNRFIDLHRMSDQQVAFTYEQKDRSAVATEMITDFSDYLIQQIKDFSAPTLDNFMPMLPRATYPLYASASDVSEGGDEKDVSFDFEIKEINASSKIETLPRSLANCLPFEGLLFYVDEVSETAPSKGSTLPLYVDSEVANAVVEQINASGGLPLDAHDTLSGHANKEIVGVINKAKVEDDALWVIGHLFPWSNGEKVSLIASNQDSLGMSMNAHAITSPEVIKGVKVSRIKSLEILGANILYASKATYQRSKTKVHTTQIAASRLEDNDMTTGQNVNQVQSYLEQMNKSLNGISRENSRITSLLESQEERLAALESGFSEIQAERTQVSNNLRRQTEKEIRDSERSEFLAAMQSTVAKDRDALKQEIIAAVGVAPNRRQQPGRVTTPLVDLVASGDSGGKGLNELEVAKIQLNTLRAAGIAGPQRAKLIEQISYLEQTYSAQ